VKFDPFTGRRLACASSANFGMKGAGRLWIFEHMQPRHPPQMYLDGTVESNPTVLAAAMADGTVAIFDLKVPSVPVVMRKEHQRECSGIDWNAVSKDRLLSTAYDGSIKIASWSPREANLIVSAGSDCSIRLWDARAHNAMAQVLSRAHDNEILSVDWNKWDPMQFATGSVDLTVRIWDWRMSSSPATTLRGHHRAVKKVKWSPFSGGVLFSVGYDMMMRVWDLKSLNPMVGMWEGHDEFVTGIGIKW
ncbi:Peroxisomal targeting signal type 2 receptor, partial [Paramicrosporidium saccamoebae]